MGTEQDSGTGIPGLANLFGEMMLLPVRMFSSSMETFGQIVRSVQGSAEPHTTLPSPTIPVAPPDSRPVADPSTNPSHSPQPFEQRASKSNHPGEPAGISHNDSKEKKMSCDTNLSDDDVKLVQYNIVCIKRGHEHVLLCNGCKVFTDVMDQCGFESWVIADFIRETGGDIGCDAKDVRVTYCVAGRWPKQDLHYEEKELVRLTGIEDAIRALKPKDD